MDAKDGVWATVAQLIEQLRTSTTGPQQKEFHLRNLLDLISNNADAKTAVSCHPQAIPVLVTILRSSSSTNRNLTAMIIEILSSDEETKTKILLGGSVPALLALLKSGPQELQFTAARVLYALSKANNEDKVGPKIFTTEGIVQYLWELLKTTRKIARPLDGVLTGTLRNLSKDAHGFWEVAAEAEALDILLKLILSGSPEAQAHCCHLLSDLILVERVTCNKMLQSGCVDQLLQLLSPGNDLSVRAEAAGVLKSLSQVNEESKDAIINSNGISALIRATVAPCKEGMSGAVAQSLQENAMGALANISGGLHSIIKSLAESLEVRKSEHHISDTLGALASALMVLDEKDMAAASSVEVHNMEDTLIRQIKVHGQGLIQERSIEALASLYGNKYLDKIIPYSEVKKLLVNLITMTSGEVQTELLKSLLMLTSRNTDVWHAFQQRQGIQLLISLLGVCTEEEQDCAVALLSLISQENEDSNWAITAAGGIPPLVQILEVGSMNAKEDSATILENLCTHSEDIRSCVEKAGAVPALLWLLKNANKRGQEIAARTLKHLVSKSDAIIISQLNAMLVGETPESKFYISDTLGHLLSVCPLADILIEGSPTNEAYQALIKMLASFKEDVQEQAASAFAKLLQARKDLCQNPMIADIMAPLHKILLIKNERIAMHAVQCLAALFDSMDKNTLVAEAAPTTIAPIFRLCSSDNIEVIEQAISALANLFAEKDLSTKLKFGDLINPVTRVLREGTNLHAKAQAAKAIYRHLEVHMIDDALAERLCQSGTIIALVSLLSITDNDANVKHQVLEALMSLTRSIRVDHPLWSILFQVCHTITPIIDCLAIEKPLIQDKAVQVLSKFCKYHPTALGEEITTTSKCIAALANRVIASPSLEVQIGAASLLICAAKEHRQQTMCVITEINCLLELIQALVGMLSTEASLSDEIHWANVDKDNGPHVGRQSNKLIDTDDLSEERKIVSLWLLSIIASCDYDIRCVITEAGAIDAIIRELGCYTSLKKKNQEENGGMWVGVLLLSILFQDKDVLRLPAVNRTIPILATLLQSDDTAARYFSGQAITNLLLTGDRSTILAVANSGAPVGLVHLLGNFDADTTNFQDLVQEFSLVPNPAQTALEYLFRTNDIKMGSTARKVIPALIELMTPNAERPSAPLFAEGLLTLLATGSDTNKVLMADAGAVEALTRYLSLGPKDNMEECTADLMRILFSTRELKCHPSALGALEQLIAVLRLGSKNSRYSAARALQELFEADHIKNHDNARQVIPPLMEMLRTGSEKEQKVSLKTLANLSYDNQPKAMLIADPDSKCLEFLCKILWSDCSLELKEEAAGLCFTLFAFSRIRAYPAAVACIEPLILLAGDRAAKSIWLPILHALNHLLDNTSLIETALDHGAVCMLVDMLRTNDHLLQDVSLPSLVKLARQSDHCRAEMEEYGVMEIIFRLFPSLSDYSSASAAELLQLLTTAGRVLEIPASTAVELLLSVLSRPGLSTAGQYNIMHVLLTIIGGSQQLVNYKLSPNQPIQNLILLLDSPSQQVQQLASELFSHLLVERKLDENVITKKVVLALVQLTVQGMHKAVFALETASTVLPQEVAEAGGIQELSKVIMQLDPLPPHELWESASAAICNILQYGPIFFWHVPPEAFVRMLHSENESTVVISLQGMLTLQKENVAYADAFAKCGAIDALMELLSCHRCEEATAQVLETLLNDSTVRSMKTTYRIVAPLANYLLDPETQNRGAQILSALALGDLFQRPVFSSPSSDVVLGCKALMSILQGHSHEDVKTVALRALQNLLANGRANRQALSEAGAIDLVCGLLCSRDRDTAAQAATLAKFLCCGQSVEENASIEVVKALSVALQNALHEGLSVNDDILRAIAVIFTNFPKLCTAEPATLCIPLLIQAMKEGSDASRDAGLDIFSLMRQTWTASPKEVVKAQTVAMADVIPILQSLIKAGTTKFHERATTLLLSLPGSLSVKIKQGKNLKQGMGSTNAYCKLTLGNSPPKETKVVSNNVNPEWGQVFAWPFERAPRGQKVHIDCRNKSTFSKKSMGKLTIQVDRVIALGTVTGNYTLQSEKNKDGTPRVLEIEISWSSG